MAHLTFIHNGLNLFHGIVLVHGSLPPPDSASGCPYLNGVRILPQPAADRFSQIPGTVHTLAPWMSLSVPLNGHLVGISVGAGGAESAPRCNHPRAFHYLLFDHVADMDAEQRNLPNGCKACLQALMGLLYGYHCLLKVILRGPVRVIVRQVPGKVQMDIDQARHDRLTANGMYLISVRNCLIPACIGDLVSVHKHKAVLHCLCPCPIDQQPALKCIFFHNFSPLILLLMPRYHRS